MAAEPSRDGADAEGTGEAIHLPGPSFLPVIVGLGVTLLVVGVVISPILVVLGVLIALFAIVRWVRDTRRDISELPLQH